ncbi:phosphatidylethanolamine-binding protein 4 isoform X4 [Struthio camelus]|uniref:phosphatidylethanolamine-binding protein 4 isoform X4 n=1 Tax=Struthio camelus TaxID=8801 RepID=UPI003603DFD5
MKLLGVALLAAALLGTLVWAKETLWGDGHPQTCFFELLSSLDNKFCRGDLEVVYPELGDVGCTYIPACRQYRHRLSREWSSPKVRYPQADKSKKYVLVMVDPDAPSRADPRNRFWRHWLVTDIRGADLRAGNPRGHVLTGERGPPSTSAGFGPCGRAEHCPPRKLVTAPERRAERRPRDFGLGRRCGGKSGSLRRGVRLASAAPAALPQPASRRGSGPSLRPERGSPGAGASPLPSGQEGAARRGRGCRPLLEMPGGGGVSFFGEAKVVGKTPSCWKSSKAV